MRNIHDLGYFERIALIDRVGKAIAKSQGWQVNANSNVLESIDPRLRSYGRSAKAAIEEIEAYMSEIREE